MGETGDILFTQLDLRGAAPWQSGMGGVVQSLLTFDRANLRAAGSLALLTGGVALAGAATREITRDVMAAGEEQATFNRAVGNLKGTIPLGEMKQFASEVQALTGVGDDSTAALLGILGSFQVLGSDATRSIMPILNAAEALKDYGITAEQLAGQVGKAVQGGMWENLRRSGVFVDEAKFKVDRLGAVLDALQLQGGNAAEAFRATLPGAMMALQNQVGDLREEIGNLFGGGDTGGGLVNLLVGITKGATDVVGALNEMDPAAKTALGIAVVGGATAAAVALGKAVLQTARLATENVKLTNAALGGSAAAKGQAAAITAEGQAAASAARDYNALAAAKRGAAVPVPSPFANPGMVPVPRSARTPGAAAEILGGALASGEMNAAGAAKTAAAARAASALGRAGKFAGSPAGMAAMFGGSMVLSLAPQGGTAGKAADVAQAALGGAATGAALGSMVPGVGTAVGAAAGGILGAGSAYLRIREEKDAPAAEKRDAKETDPVLEELRKQNQTLQEQLAELRGIREGKLPFDTSDVPGALQMGAVLYAREMG
ncbi:MAG TPA: hypothetical protein PLE61_15300 [Vicinamibacterales bacterium]|nr:hypothetical protein [Vicinamibacterales bacterium]